MYFTFHGNKNYQEYNLVPLTLNAICASQENPSPPKETSLVAKPGNSLCEAVFKTTILTKIYCFVMQVKLKHKIQSIVTLFFKIQLIYHIKMEGR